MSDKPDWIAQRINQAKKDYPSIADPVVDEIEVLFGDSFLESEIPGTKMKDIACNLLEANIPYNLNEESKH